MPLDVHYLSVIAGPPYPARYRTQTLNEEAVTASEARQSMQSEVMDCFTAFAMTGLLRESKVWRPMTSDDIGCFTAFAMARLFKEGNSCRT
jgi:hypothetical protein